MFLTDIDPRAAVKGSRDSLGLVPLWSHFGRQVVGNLTTVTTSVRGFTTLLLGYHFAREAQDRHGEGAESTLHYFLKFEQLASYSRSLHGDNEFRGVERVKKALAASSTVHLSAETRDQTLGDQKVYGLWGLYSAAARSSGLLVGEDLTPAARRFVEEQYVHALTKADLRDGRPIVDLLQKPRATVHLRGRHARIAKALARLHGSKLTAAERHFYREHLLHGGPEDATCGQQPRLAEIFARLPSDTHFDRTQLRAALKEARGRKNGYATLAASLQTIDHLESVLAPAAAGFGFALARHGQTLSSVAQELEKRWGSGLGFVDAAAIRAFRPSIAEALRAFRDDAPADRWVQVAEALAAGKYEAFLRQLLDQNAALMRIRNGSDPWARLQRGRLDVRFRDERWELPSKRELPTLWWNTYFLNAFKAVGVTLGTA